VSAVEGPFGFAVAHDEDAWVRHDVCILSSMGVLDI
jgi:hypothetical protein